MVRYGANVRLGTYGLSDERFGLLAPSFGGAVAPELAG